MKATIDVPDNLYRRVKARSALEGRSIRDVAIELFERWLSEAPSRTTPLAEADRPSAATAWMERWDSIGLRIAGSSAGEPSTREVLSGDRDR
jgi:hypothetical protein